MSCSFTSTEHKKSQMLGSKLFTLAQVEGTRKNKLRQRFRQETLKVLGLIPKQREREFQLLVEELKPDVF